MKLASLAESVVSGPDHKVVKIPDSGKTDLLLQNHDGHLALVFRLRISRAARISDASGFVIDQSESDGRLLIRLTADEVGPKPASFLKFAELLVERCRHIATDSEIPNVIESTTEEFRQFLSRRKGRLSEEEVRGLFAELTFLNHFTENRSTFDSAVRAWRSPFTLAGLGMHDFVFADGTAIEVKSSRQRPKSVRVSSDLQLQPDSTGLDLLVLPLEEVNEGGQSLRELAKDIDESVRAMDCSVIRLWTDALAETGLDLDDDFYDRWQFATGSWLRYRVVEGFPSIDIQSLPEGISDVSYSLSLVSIAKFSDSFEKLVDAKRVQHA